jgi:hypothetical protein
VSSAQLAVISIVVGLMVVALAHCSQKHEADQRAQCARFTCALGEESMLVVTSGAEFVCVCAPAGVNNAEKW